VVENPYAIFIGHCLLQPFVAANSDM
jgi:hypothetical protein